ncbi:hypothetical protein [Nocardia seriolae]|uniref:Uncharacterized protein n=1 Tax=Nocardia seriolae TaxID=37332 RepID=A0A0B8NF73_9NOCA|nr:hypothetical protein [Nocardia seriolae]APA96130.1 hypothetical protein NS506_02063 [Nocardia seriolae]MTJ65791.1 DUF3052 domain-containing protein [Nocardia seriolae]MTJ75377.1 DUF3052 domain-containing protein [Nocardia seriolae]MTJ86276.1 DUF3052 domain-containing protein [Nocardia seriolae]MTK30272.1 DUF3052 domain-containing protein [Nocardia seriolae]
MAGYSGTPLPRKLGIKEESRVLLAGAPQDFELGELPVGVELHRRAGAGPYDVILGFCPDRATMVRRFAAWRGRTAINGGLWLAWPKKASGVPTDLGENAVREYGLAQGLVDNKGIAVDDIWSGLRFVIRLRDR